MSTLPRPSFALPRDPDPGDDAAWEEYWGHVAAGRIASTRLSAEAEARLLAAEAVVLGRPAGGGSRR